MKRLLKFLRTTVVGGILFLLPIVLIAILVDKECALGSRTSQSANAAK
jgi:hypothetical protein